MQARPRRGAHARHQDRRRARRDRAREPRPGDAVPARRRRPRSTSSPTAASPPATPTSTSAASARRASTSRSTACRSRTPRTRRSTSRTSATSRASWTRSRSSAASAPRASARPPTAARSTSRAWARPTEPRLEAQAGGGSWGSGARHARGLGPGRRRLRPLRPLLGADDRRLPRPLRRRPAHRLLRRDARGRALALQALRLLRPRAARSSRTWRPTRRRSRRDLRHNDLTPGREGRLRPGLRAGAVHAGSRAPRRRSRRRPTTTALRAGSASGTPATRDLQQYGIDGHFVGLVLGATHRRGRLGLNWGAHANDFSARPLHGRGGRRARLPRTPASRTSSAAS